MSDITEKLKEKIDSANDLAWDLCNNDVTQARKLLEETYRLSTAGEFRESPYHEGQIRSLTGLGYVHRISGDLNKAMQYLIEARQLSEATGLLQAIVFVNFGSLYSLLGDLLQSLQSYEKGLAAARRDKDTRYEINALIGISNIYAMRAEFSEAIDYIEQSLELSTETQDIHGQIRALNNIASIHQIVGNYENAQIMIERALALIDNDNFMFEKIAVLSTIGEIQFSIGNYEQALSNLQQAFSLSERTLIKEPQPSILIYISKIYREQQETEREFDVLHQAIEVSQQLQHFDAQQVCHQRLSAIYECQQDYASALKHYQQFHVIKETAFNEAADQKLKQLRVLYETETHKQAAEIARLRNIELTQTKEAVETANRVKSAFLANMSHEMRTPLNVILGFAQLMQNDSSLSIKNIENLITIIRSGEHLLEFINDVLDMSKIEAAKMDVHFSVFDCYQLFAELESMFSVSVKHKSLEFTIHCSHSVPQWIKTDERILRQILINLVGNAVKFTTRGHVDLRINYSNDRLCFEVEDTGPGIAQEELETLFTPFHQSLQQESTEKGTGLGLAISQAYVQLIGHSYITVTSELNKGSVFRFDIPVEVISRQSRVNSVPSRCTITLEAGHSDYRILVADDHQDSRLALMQFLKSIGFNVEEAADGKQAVKISHTWQPHLIFMDVEMPEMDGYGATRQIKDHNPQIVVIALTSNKFKNEKVNGSGFDDFMLKPFRHDLILETISLYLHVPYGYGDRQIPEAAPMLNDDRMLELLQIQPVLWKQKLHHHAVAGSKNGILKLTEEIQPQHSELAETIRTLAKNYQFEKLITLIEGEAT